jgi:hypothetical protein
MLLEQGLLAQLKELAVKYDAGYFITILYGSV